MIYALIFIVAVGFLGVNAPEAAAALVIAVLLAAPFVYGGSRRSGR